MTTTRLSNVKQSESLWNLGGLTLSQLGRRVLDEIIANNVLGHAAELAFFFLFALFPLILIVVTSFGLFAADRIELQNDLLSYFADLLPSSAFQLLKTVVDEVATHASSGKLTFGIVSSLWAVSAGIDSMITSLNLAHHVRETRPLFKVRAIAIGLSFVISILLLAALFMVLTGNRFVNWLGAALGLRPIFVLVWKASQWPGVIFVVLLSCALIYRFGPNLQHRRRWHWVSPGGAFGVVVWLGASYGFRIYLHFFNRYSAAYGSLGAVMILMLWLYIFGLAYLIGGEINAVIEHNTRSIAAREPETAS
jgi:membrane protein